MLTMTKPAPFGALQVQPPDSLLSLIKLYKADPRPTKIDLGVGVYRNAEGDTPVFAAIKAAEAKLLAEQASKSYLGPEGDTGFVEKIQPIVFGQGKAAADIVGVQTPGGTGALRAAAELIHAAKPGATIWLGTPSWPVHAQIFNAVGLNVQTYRYYDAADRRLAFDDMVAALSHADAGDFVLLHASCHNPTGVDLSFDQWREVTKIIVERGLVPFVDCAYQGLGQGLEEDAAGLRHVFENVDEALLAYSCDKNFGVYRERTGALFARSRQNQEAVFTTILLIARGCWSMPPDHGAAAVRLILESAELTAQWRAELDEMRERINSIRHALADADPRLEPIREQRGMFSILPVTPAQVEALRNDHGIYMAPTGRINIAGLNAQSVGPLVQALAACLGE
jgi:aromatic-amino-acid transaminase